jgi:hypothetical protein
VKTRDGLEYAISFDTKEMPGKVVTVTIALSKSIIGPNDKVRVDLADHPLYHHIVRYVKDNPR